MKYRGRTVMDLARERGSAAATRAGAWRYLLTRLEAEPLPLPDVPAGRQTTPWLRRETRSAYRARYAGERQGSRGLAMAREAGLWLRDDAVAVAEKLSRTALVQASKELTEAWPYRRSQSRWAGGDIVVNVELADVAFGSEGDPLARRPGASVRAERVWSHNGKWSGTNTVADLRVTARALDAGLLVAGLVHVDRQPVGHREERAVWLEQGPGQSCKVVAGWLVRGHHVPGGTLEHARSAAAKARSKAARLALDRRVSERIARLTATERAALLKRTYVRVEDSLAAGNCAPATRAYYDKVARHFPGHLVALRADVLLTDRNDAYARRAVDAALKRSAPELLGTLTEMAGERGRGDVAREMDAARSATRPRGPER